MLAAFSSPEFSRPVSLKERERLFDDPRVHFTAFSPRPESSLAVQKPPPMTDSKIQLRHKVRTPVEDTTIIYPLPTYQTWVDASDLEPIPVTKPDPEYNSNIWRNFSKDHGFSCNANGRATSALVASMYPVPIPPPSRMGNFSYGRFIQYGDIMKSKEAKAKKIETTERELNEMKRLKVMTTARVPPIDNRGRIIAPMTLRRLQSQGRIKHRPLTTDPVPEDRRTGLLFDPQVSGPASVVSRTSTVIRQKGLLWKFSYKMNNPAYDKILNEQRDIQRWKDNHIKMRKIRRSNMTQQFITYY
ncbi:testis-expressed protein 52-like isoform X2 [Styela clava]